MVQVRQSSQLTSVFAEQTSSSDVIHSGTPSLYYEYSREWAIGTGLVQNYDYSSKYYAGKSQEYANSILTDTGFIAVSESLTNINAVANDLTNIDTVAGNTTDINTCAANIISIKTVGDDLALGNDSNIAIVASGKNSIAAVANKITNVNICANNIANINTVAGDKTNIDTVAGNTSNINIVAGISTDVTSVASISSAVSAVNTNASNINAVSNDLTNINSVASDLTNIDSVVGMSSAITTVNSNSTNINTCATSIGNINICAANISTIADKVSKSGDTMTGDLTISKNTATLFLNGVGLGSSLFNHWASSNIKALTAQVDSGFSCYLGLRYNTSNNTDYAEASTGVKQSITNWAFPSTTYTDLSSHWGASGFTVTAANDGYMFLNIDNSGNNAYASLWNTTTNFGMVCAPSGTNLILIVLPVAKGHVIQVSYTTTGALNAFGLFSAIGG